MHPQKHHLAASTSSGNFGYGRISSSMMGTSHNMSALIQALRAGDLDEVRAAIAADPKVARQPRLVGAAAGRAMQPALVLLKNAGADLNASWRNYRPLHNQIGRASCRESESQSGAPA